MIIKIKQNTIYLIIVALWALCGYYVNDDFLRAISSKAEFNKQMDILTALWMTVTLLGSLLCGILLIGKVVMFIGKHIKIKII